MDVRLVTECETVPDPSPELMLISALVLHLSKGCPKRAGRIIDGMAAGLAHIAEVQPAIRIRSARYDTRAQECLRQSQAWLRKTGPAFKLVAGK